MQELGVHVLEVLSPYSTNGSIKNIVLEASHRRECTHDRRKGCECDKFSPSIQAEGGVGKYEYEKNDKVKGLEKRVTLKRKRKEEENVEQSNIQDIPSNVGKFHPPYHQQRRIRSPE